jgi:DNA invertase Pin-like site-specific DNA recombinase
MRVALYSRVSTDGQTVEQQIEQCRKYCDYKGFEVASVIEEVGSGKDVLKRPKFQELWNQLRRREFDGVVVTRIDRLGRNTRDMVMFFDEMQNNGIQIHSVNENLDATTPIGKAVISIIITMAQLEREQISLATKQRLQALKNMGKKLGRPSGSKDGKPRRKSGYYKRWDKQRVVEKP